MNSKMTTNSQLSTTESSKNPKQKQTKQTTRIGRESQKWRSHGGLSVGMGKRVNGGKGTGINKHNLQVQNSHGEGKNSIGNGEAKQLICMTHGQELRGDCWKERGNYWVEEGKGDKLGQFKQHNQ